MRALLALVFLDTLFVSISAGGLGPGMREMLFGTWLVGTALILAGEMQLLDRFGRIAIVTGHGAYLILVVSGIVATLRYVLATRHVDLDLIFGAVVAYLLMAIGFGFIYTVLLTLDPQAFNVGNLPDLGSYATLESQMIYFSFVTIATLGYGDIIPHLPLPRILAGLEAVIGQFYIAVVIAWLVSRHAANQGK
jgi:hypothetical protein